MPAFLKEYLDLSYDKQAAAARRRRSYACRKDLYRPTHSQFKIASTQEPERKTLRGASREICPACTPYQSNSAGTSGNGPWISIPCRSASISNRPISGGDGGSASGVA